MFPKLKANSESMNLMLKTPAYPNGGKAFLDLECSSGKIISFCENSPLKKLGIDQVFLDKDKTTGSKMLSFWQDGIPIKAKVLSDKKAVDEKRYSVMQRK